MPDLTAETKAQFFKYVIVGLSSNVSVYGLYVILSLTITGPKLAMTVAYAVGMLIAFIANRHWTFKAQAPHGSPLGRYLLAYGLGYVINYCALLVFVDYFGMPHLYVQAVMILLIALLLFLLQKHWVFKPQNSVQLAQAPCEQPGER